MTYSEIQNVFGERIPKSTLSYICRNIELSKVAKNRIRSIEHNNLLKARQQAVKANKNKLNKFLDSIEKQVVDQFKEYSTLDLKLALAMLYWGEGSKRSSFRGLSFGSSDPHLLLTYIVLLDLVYAIQKRDMKFRISCRFDQDELVIMNFWTTSLGVGLDQFYPLYKDVRTKNKITKKKNYHGVCVATCAGTDKQYELSMVSKHFYEKLKKFDK